MPIQQAHASIDGEGIEAHVNLDRWGDHWRIEAYQCLVPYGELEEVGASYKPANNRRRVYKLPLDRPDQAWAQYVSLAQAMTAALGPLIIKRGAGEHYTTTLNYGKWHDPPS
jgi:hypothetical protein